MKKLVISLITFSLLFSCVSDGEKQSEAMSVIKNWIGYHNKHDYAKLMAVTADTIDYYGEQLTPNELILRLTKVREDKTQAYEQILGELILDSGNVEDGILQFNFINRTIDPINHKIKDVPTKILVSSGEDGNWELREINYFLGDQSNSVTNESAKKRDLDTKEKTTVRDEDNSTSSIPARQHPDTIDDFNALTISDAQEALQRYKQRKEERTSDEVKISGRWNNTFNYNLSGFGISSAPSVKNLSQDHGSVSIEVCLDKDGKIKALQKTGGTSTSAYLKAISIDAVKQIEFFPIGNQSETNCGTITFHYALQ